MIQAGQNSFFIAKGQILQSTPQCSSKNFEQLSVTALRDCVHIIQWASKTSAKITLEVDELSNERVWGNAALPALTSWIPEHEAGTPGEQTCYRIWIRKLYQSEDAFLPGKDNRHHSGASSLAVSIMNTSACLWSPLQDLNLHAVNKQLYHRTCLIKPKYFHYAGLCMALNLLQHRFTPALE